MSSVFCRAGDAPARNTGFTNAVVLSVANQVEVRRYGAQPWDPAYVQPTNQVLNPGDRLRTGRDSRTLLRLSNLTDFPVGELTQLEIPREETPRRTVRLLKGIIYFFHRDKPGEFQVDTPTVSAVVRGTEFTVEVAEDGQSKFQVLDGELALTNGFGSLNLSRGEEGVAALGQNPRRTAVITTSVANVVQWCLYYPGILNLDELHLPVDTQRALAESLAAYRAGDLPGALASYPADREPQSDEERIYRAALLLTVGAINKSEKLIASLSSRSTPVGVNAEDLGNSLKTLVAAVKFQKATTAGRTGFNSNSASAWLAESYWQQSQFHLQPALDAARRATEIAPDFAFAWTRVAELEFGFGRIRTAKSALDRSLTLAPRNAQALALNGFLRAALNQTEEAIHAFYEAILADGALGNSWLGRGLCRIRRGDAAGGRQDLLVAATLEPQRALLRSYLGKAFADSGDARNAMKEFALAEQLDPNDPTAWLYSALLLQQENRINEAVRELERSTELNENRRVYRSRLLLDQDRAVRGANLAGVYDDAGMADVSLREAGRAVNADYADYSAHLFLGATYNSLRDPSGFNLRYETPWLSEYLVANLLAPVAAGALSPEVTQQEYARLFERNRLGLVSSTEYRSGGDWVQNAVQYGIRDNFSYSIEEAYRYQNGSRPNNDLEDLTVTAKLKEQLTPRDNVFLQASCFSGRSGDLAQYFYQTNAQTGLRVKETQEPLALAGWHHEWNPASHTLVCGGFWRDTLTLTNPQQPVLFLRRIPPTQINGVPAGGLPLGPSDFRSEFEGVTTELQQILRVAEHTFVGGVRGQVGSFDTRSYLGGSYTATNFVNGTNALAGSFSSPSSTNQVSPDFQRLSVYAYDNWQIVSPVLLTVGVSCDQLRSPVNYLFAPVTDREETTDQFCPKAGLIWTPAQDTTVRAAYTRSLGGVSFDQSFRLEPSQVAGFNQSFRSLIPESVAGGVAGARFETRSASIEQKLGSGTYLGFQAEWFTEDVERNLGEIDLVSIFPPPPGFAFTNSVRNRLAYDEKNLLVTVNQLIGRDWSLGARYRLSDAELTSDLVDIPISVSSGAHSEIGATLHEVRLFALFNHPSGFFGQVDSVWMHQTSHNYTPALPEEDFWQFNLSVGYRFFARRLEARLGILNLTDQDYQLNPLNLMSDVPRERTLFVSLRCFF